MRESDYIRSLKKKKKKEWYWGIPKGLNQSLRSRKGLPEKMMPLCDLTQRRRIRSGDEQRNKHAKNAEGKKLIFEKINKIDKTSKTDQVEKGWGEH